MYTIRPIIIGSHRSYARIFARSPNTSFSPILSGYCVCVCVCVERASRFATRFAGGGSGKCLRAATNKGARICRVFAMCSFALGLTLQIILTTDLCRDPTRATQKTLSKGVGIVIHITLFPSRLGFKSGNTHSNWFGRTMGNFYLASWWEMASGVK